MEGILPNISAAGFGSPARSPWPRLLFSCRTSLGTAAFCWQHSWFMLLFALCQSSWNGWGSEQNPNRPQTPAELKRRALSSKNRTQVREAVIGH